MHDEGVAQRHRFAWLDGRRTDGWSRRSTALQHLDLWCASQSDGRATSISDGEAGLDQLVKGNTPQINGWLGGNQPAGGIGVCSDLPCCWLEQEKGGDSNQQAQQAHDYQDGSGTRL
jgi:hypothetical protein